MYVWTWAADSHAVDRSYWDFCHFVKCQNARMQLHAMHSSNPRQTLAHIGMYMTRAAHTYALLLGSRRNTGVILGSWVAIYIIGTLRSCAIADESRSIGMGSCANMRGESMGSNVPVVSSFFYTSVRAAYLH
jgi:hypothetical protein